MNAAVVSSAFRRFELPQLNSFAPLTFVPRAEIPQALLAAEATTYGWDTVNCIRLPLVNQVLQASKSYPPELSMTLNPEENWSISTSFDPWQIAAGGSGAILMMKLPLKAASMTFGSDKLAFTQGSVLISLKLRYVPQLPTRFTRRVGDDPAQDIEKLIADAKARTPDDPAVVVQRVNYGSAQPSEKERALFEASLGLLLIQNIAAFSHVFSVVNLNQKAAEKAFFWLKPTYTSYAYFQGLDDNSSYFAVLNQTEGRSPEGLTNQVPASAIPPGMNGSILISNRLFMLQMVLPGLGRTFTHADAESFRLSDRGETISSTKPIALAPVKVGAIDYYPIMDSFRMQIVGDEIQIQSKVSVNISPGIDAYVDATYFHKLGLTKKPDGSQTLTFEESGKAIINSWYNVAFWVTLTELLVTIVGAVIGAIAGPAIKDITKSIIVVVLIIIVAGVAQAVPEVIADVLSKGTAAALPSIGAMLEDATAPVTWPEASGFVLKSAELNGAFQLGGSVEITPPVQA